MQRKFLPLSSSLLLIGILVAIAALGAPAFDLDRSPGWGPGRIALLAIGIIVAFAGLLLWLDTPGVIAVWKFCSVFPNRAWHTSAAANCRRMAHEYWLFVPISAVVITIYIWFVSSGTWTSWVSPTHYYIDLARGFLQGHLYLAIKVPPALLTSPDPYARLPNGALQGQLDVAYYQGKYYSPWGPAPALIEILLHWTTHSWFRDMQLAFGFFCGIYIIVSLIALLLWDRHFSRLPKWTLWTSICLIGLAGPVTSMLENHTSARIYEAAVTSGQMFLMCGMLSLIAGWDSPASKWTTPLTAVFFVLAAGSRPNLLLAIGIVTSLLYVHAWSVRRDSLRPFFQAVAFSLILLAGFAVLGWYNWARFDSPFETGYFYQITSNMMHYHLREIFSANYILPNLYNYTIGSPLVNAEFPFIHAQYNPTLSALLPPPQTDYYAAQRISGILYLVPFAVFAFPVIIEALASLFRWPHSTNQDNLSSLRSFYWAILMLAGICLGAFGFLQLFFWAAMRYIEEFAPVLILLSSLGFWQVRQRIAARPSWIRLTDGIGIFLAAASILISILIGLSVNSGRFLLTSTLASLISIH